MSILTFVNAQFIVFAIYSKTLLTAEIIRFSVSCIFMPLFYTSATVSIAFGLIILVCILFLPIVLKILPTILQKILTPILPSSAIHSITGKVGIGNIEYTNFYLALLILTVWALSLSFLAVWRFKSRDL